MLELADKDMIQFLKRFGFVALILLAVLVVLNQLYVFGVLSQINIARTERQFRDFDGDIRLLVMGDSHAAQAFDPSKIAGSFNYAVPSETYEQSYYKLRRIMASNHSIEVLVLPVDINSFCDCSGDQYAYLWYWDDFMSVAELREATGADYATLFIGRYLPVIGNGADFSRLVYRGRTTEIVDGWHISDDDFSTFDDKDGYAESRVMFHLKNRSGIVVNRALFESFIGIIEMCQEGDIDVVLVKYPLSPQYRDVLEEKDINLDQFYRYIQKSVEDYDYVYLLDYQDRYDDLSWYSDADHLNRVGSGHFMDDLAEDLEDLI